MLNIHTLVLGDYQTNCYIVNNAGSADCVVIDPGFTPHIIIGFLEKKGLCCKAILLTHGHFDHDGGVAGLVQEYGCPVYLNEKELTLPPFFPTGTRYHTHTYQEGDRVSAAGMTFAVMETPGHTPGSVCLCVEDVLFTGDTLFEGSCGRTDFPGSSPKDMRRSLDRLAELEKDYAVYSGHGSATTLLEEKRRNPYLRGYL